MRCLLVEPSSVMSRILGQILRDAGSEEVVTVADGEAAIEYLEAAHDDERPGLIVTELDFRNGDGLDMIREVRGEDWGAGIPILVVTSRNARVDVENAVEAGVQGYLLKPFEPETLVRRVQHILAAAVEAEPAPALSAESPDGEEPGEPAESTKFPRAAAETEAADGADSLPEAA